MEQESPVLTELTTAYMKAANSQLPANPHTQTFAIAGSVWPSNPLVRGADDWVVGTWSAELPPESTRLARVRYLHTKQLEHQDVFAEAYAALYGDGAAMEAAPGGAAAASPAPALQPALLASGDLAAGETAVFTAPLLGRGAWLGVSWTSGEPVLSLTAPDGRRYSEAGPGVLRHESDGPLAALRLLHPLLQENGHWRLAVTAQRGPLHFTALAAEGGPRLEPVAPAAPVLPGAPARLAVRLQGATASPALHVTAYLRSADGAMGTLTLAPIALDPSNRGLTEFATNLPTAGLAPGFYPLIFEARSDDPHWPLVRYALGGLSLAEGRVRPIGTGDPAAAGAPAPTPARPEAPDPTAADAPALAGPLRWETDGRDLLLHIPLRLPRADTYVLSARLGPSLWAAAWLDLPAGDGTPTLRFPGAAALAGATPLRDLSVYPQHQPHAALLQPAPESVLPWLIHKADGLTAPHKLTDN